MRKYCLLLPLFTTLLSCNSNGKINEDKINKAREALQQKVEKGADTLVSKLKKIKDKLEKGWVKIIHQAKVIACIANLP